MNRYLQLLEDILIDCLKDLKSLRVWLILWAYIFNGVILYLVYLNKADYKLSGIGIGLLTIVYTFFFASKNSQAKMEASKQDDQIQ